MLRKIILLPFYLAYWLFMAMIYIAFFPIIFLVKVLSPKKKDNKIPFDVKLGLLLAASRNSK